MIGPAGRRHKPTKVAAPVASPVVGTRLDALCAKCRKATSHVLVRVVGAKPTWVECSVCSTPHAFRPPGARPRRGASAPAPVPVSAEEAWKRGMSRARGPAVDYCTSRHFEVGQRLSHPSFGEGVVTRLASGTVCAVTFLSGEVKLLMGS